MAYNGNTPETLSEEGFVYFIRAGKTASIKIGWAVNPYKRLDQLQTGSPHTLHLVGYYPASRKGESEWHGDWRALRVRGEWFTLDNELRMAINRRLNEGGATRYLSIALDRRTSRKQMAPSPRQRTEGLTNRMEVRRG